MTGFLYYLPGRDRDVKIADVRALGLGYAFEEALTPRQCIRGPDGKNGVIVATSDQRIGYYHDKQEWRQIPGLDAWVGMYREERPTPEELARAEQLDGTPVQLEDGHHWLIPKARRWVAQEDSLRPACNLPQLLSRDADGQWWLGEVKGRYRALWKWVCDYERAAIAASQQQVAGEVFQFTFAVDDMAMAALQANYRVSATEVCDLLGAYDEQARRRIIDVLLDNATWQGWVKKKQAAAVPTGGNSSSGAEQPIAAE